MSYNAAMDRAASLVLCLVVAACSESEPAKGEPLVATTLSATFAGEVFTPIYGFASVDQPSYIVMFGDGAVRCGVQDEQTPPPGHTVSFRIDSLAVGAHDSDYTEMVSNDGDVDGVNSQTGTVMITASTGLSLTGTVSWSYTDPRSRMFGVSGTFEVHVCP